MRRGFRSVISSGSPAQFGVCQLVCSDKDFFDGRMGDGAALPLSFLPADGRPAPRLVQFFARTRTRREEAEDEEKEEDEDWSTGEPLLHGAGHLPLLRCKFCHLSPPLDWAI